MDSDLNSSESHQFSRSEGGGEDGKRLIDFRHLINAKISNICNIGAADSL